LVKAHIGCGSNLLHGYINVDIAPQQEKIKQGTLTNLPFEDNALDEILTEHVFEHLTFSEEQIAWKECYRVLKKGGKLTIEVPDFEWLCKTFLAANDKFREFYQVGAVDHYFGNGKALDERWSIVTTLIFGNQNGSGQYHYTAYTVAKIHDIAQLVGFDVQTTQSVISKGGQSIRAQLVKQ
jgi:ubiquinone/menaquinone biosynthesis C-methylase UbiE